ncbi:DUF4389 domain-containing protein [Granulosicoccaceae sp. 1_MG-2023]|nr:DUF4389 domain-containing protein [Granulosicoccaceae sp. 1_MG-2023]
MADQQALTTSDVLMRALYMLLFAVIWSVAEMALAAVAVIQLVLCLLTRETNLRLRVFGAALSRYIYQIAQFLTFTSENKPFPFGDWPSP